MTKFTATYSPDDNKLRLYATSRLEPDLYQRAKKAGFRWAPKQDLFFAFWSPAAEDLLMELAGEIDDEDKTLTTRAEERADRFTDYQEKRAQDAERAEQGVSAIADGIPFGQPILVGHHSEKRARKDAERIENRMKKVVKMWETSQYWKSRAAGALAHAKYKELPEVRARRIKTIEADVRRCRAAYTPKSAPMVMQRWNAKDGDLPEPHVMCGQGCAAHPVPVASLPGIEAHYKRWIDHYEHRLEYEYAMLNEQGAIDLVMKKGRPKQFPICNYRQAEIVVEVAYSREPKVLKQVEMTTAQYSAIRDDQRHCVKVERSHRVRVAIVRDEGKPYYMAPLCAVFLTDSKVHEKPAPGEAPKKLERPVPVYIPTEPDQVEQRIEAMKESLEHGVKVVSAPQLFPTPQALAQRVIEALDIRPRDRVLEPSAGTGNLLMPLAGYMVDHEIVAVEINHGIASILSGKFPLAKIHNADFLECNGELGTFDKIAMNPPFAKQEDIEHVIHAIQHLNHGGKLVAIMSAGVLFRQDRKASEFRTMIADMGAEIEELPEDSFKESGTSVRTVLVTIDK